MQHNYILSATISEQLKSAHNRLNGYIYIHIRIRAAFSVYYVAYLPPLRTYMYNRNAVNAAHIEKRDCTI